MIQIDIGDNDTDQSDFVPVAVPPGSTVTVSNLAGGTLNCYGSFDAAPSSTITPTSNQAFTVGPLWLQSAGRSTVQITGGPYG